MKRYSWILILVVSLLATSCGSNASVKRTLGCAEILMIDHPDSALKLIRAIDRENITQEETFARYALRYSQALDKNCIDVTDDSLASVAVDYYMKHGSVHRKAEALYYLARVYENADDEERAADRIVQAEVFSRKVADADPYLRALCCLTMGVRYDLQGGRDEALAYYQEAEAAALKAGSLMNARQSCCNQSWLYYYSSDDLTRAKELWKRAIHFSEEGNLPDTTIAQMRVWLQSMEIISDTTRSETQRRHALLAHQSENSSLTGSVEWCWLAHYYDEAGNADSTRYYIDQVRKGAADSSWLLWVYESLCEVEQEAGNTQLALEYRVKSTAMRDSINKARNISVVQTLGRRQAAEQMQQEFTILQSRHRYQTIIGVLVLLIAVWLVWKLIRGTRMWRRRLLRQQLESRQSQEKLLQELTEASEELGLQYDLVNKLKASSGSDSREARFCEALELRLTGLRNLVDKAYTLKSKPANFVKAFSEYITVSPSAKKEVWADLQYVVNKKYNGLVDYLRETYPALGSHDLDMCCLICFGFSPAGIAFVYGYEDMGSLYNKRSRLRSRLKMDEGQKLEEFLESVCQKLRKEKEEQAKKEVSGLESPNVG